MGGSNLKSERGSWREEEESTLGKIKHIFLNRRDADEAGSITRTELPVR